jgi:hypothetical protein
MKNLIEACALAVRPVQKLLGQSGVFEFSRGD